MQLKHPELLYALFLLLTPILIHLFQLRKFKKEAFTNVAFIKDLKLKTRKSSQIKKWLILCSRLLFLAFLVLAFAQPYYSKNNAINTTQETVIYLDNSFSLQAKGKEGELLKRAIQSLIQEVPENSVFSLVTNNNTYKNTSLNAIKKELLQTNYSSSQLEYKSALLKSESLLSNSKNSNKNIIFISDFQQSSTLFNRNKKDYNLQLVKLEAESKNNIFIDSLYISKRNTNTLELAIKLKGETSKNTTIPVSLYNKNLLVTKSSTENLENDTLYFTIPTSQTFEGVFKIEDEGLTFDNEFFFNINKQDFISVLEIKDSDDTSFLNRIFTDDEFIFTSKSINTLDYSLIGNQNFIVLNELKTIPQSLIPSLNKFHKNGGSITIIPHQETNIDTYNLALKQFNIGSFKTLNPNKKSVTTINYSHPIYANNVFEKQVKNFQYPAVSRFLNSSFKNTSNLLNFEDQSPFLVSKNNVYIFTSSLNIKNSNFTLQNIVVPTFYNMALQSLQPQQLYYTVGNAETITVASKLNNDAVLSLENKIANFIPLQQKQKNKVIITTESLPESAGNYNITNKETIFKTVSYNYNTKESKLNYHNLDLLNNVNETISSVFNTLKSDLKIHELWKWFVIFALLFLCIEMLLIKFLK
jgi:hypothetical protein